MTPMEYVRPFVAGGATVATVTTFQDGNTWAWITGACAAALILLERFESRGPARERFVVAMSAARVREIVEDRRVFWCGIPGLHELHTWTPESGTVKDPETGALFGDEFVCFGHECETPDIHMEDAK